MGKEKLDRQHVENMAQDCVDAAVVSDALLQTLKFPRESLKLKYFVVYFCKIHLCVMKEIV